MRNPALLNVLRCATCTLILCFGMLAPAMAWAEEADGEQHGESAASEERSEFHRNHFRAFIGWSHEDLNEEEGGEETGSDATTIGMEYSRYFTKRIGVGAFIEQTEGQFVSDTSGILVVGRPTERLGLFAGWGVERTQFEEKEYVTRLGLAYGFHVKRVVLAPIAFVDFVAGHRVYSAGLTIGTGF